jgi:hypothetical protein
MKAEFLKLAGVKSEKAFYKKYPTEAAFFKAHPEAKKSVKKAQYGGVMDGLSDYLQSMNNVPDMNNVIQGQMQSPGVNAGMYTSTPYPAPDYNQEYMSMSLADEQLKQPKQPAPSFGDQAAKFAGPAGQIIGGFQNLKAGKKRKEDAEMWAAVTDCSS